MWTNFRNNVIIPRTFPPFLYWTEKNYTLLNRKNLADSCVDMWFLRLIPGIRLPKPLNPRAPRSL